jgi:hypothetical protein
MTPLPITRVVLYKHGVGYFERQGTVEGDAALALTFKQAEVSDVLKSLTVLDLDGGHVAAVSYDSTKPLAQLLAEVALQIPDQGSLVGLLPQIKGARVAVTGPAQERVEGVLLGVDTSERQTAEGVVHAVLVSLLSDAGAVRSFDLQALAQLELLDAALRHDLDYYLRTQLSAKKKDARTFTLFARGSGQRRVSVSYTLEAPVWKATYRIILGEEGRPPTVQGWAVVDNTQDEDWQDMRLSLVAGLPVSFVHDLYTPRYIRRPVVEVKETTGVLPPEVQAGLAVEVDSLLAEVTDTAVDFTETAPAAPAARKARARSVSERAMGGSAGTRSAVSSVATQVRERKLGDLFEYEIEHPVTIRRNQSALVPIVLRAFEGRPVLLHNRDTRPGNPMRCVEFKNTTGLTLEGGPVTVLEGGSYVGEAMLETLKPGEERLVPYAVELGVRVLDNVETFLQPIQRVVIRDRRLTTFRAQTQKTTYHFDNKSGSEQTLYLDHPRGGAEWELFDTPAPHETTESYWRFRFGLLAGVTAFAVQQRLPVQQTQALTDMSADRLGYWLEQRHVDPRTEAVLRQVIAAQHQAAELEGRLKELEQERERIHAEQARIRENLQALGDRPAEKELRERFVRTLSAQEDRLEASAAEVQARTAERTAARARVNELLAGLEYDAPVP